MSSEHLSIVIRLTETPASNNEHPDRFKTLKAVCLCNACITTIDEVPRMHTSVKLRMFDDWHTFKADFISEFTAIKKYECLD